MHVNRNALESGKPQDLKSTEGDMHLTKLEDLISGTQFSSQTIDEKTPTQVIYQSDLKPGTQINFQPEFYSGKKDIDSGIPTNFQEYQHSGMLKDQTPTGSECGCNL